MSITKGFDDKVMMKVSNAWKTLPTIGDITYGSSRTDIAIKTRASDKVRSIPGMESCPISFTVLAGVDPEDSTNTDAYNLIKTMYDAKEAREFCFGGNSNGTGGLTGTFVCLSFSTGAPIDDVKSADVQLALSGLSNTTTTTNTPNNTSGDDD